MRIVDLVVIQRVRERAGGRCRYCGRTLRHYGEVHHIFGRGAGRVDWAPNLILLGGPWDCNHHYQADHYIIPREVLLAINAREYNTTPDAITDFVYRVRRAARDAEIINELPNAEVRRNA